MKRLTVVMIVLMTFSAWSSADTYYVDVRNDGASDKNPGTKERPFKTVARAVKTVKPGDTIILREGIYRESLYPRKSGLPGKPITLKAAEGQRAILSGSDVITGWRKCTKDDVSGNKNYDRIFLADLDWTPKRLYEGLRKMTVARTPDEGWWGITEGLSLSEFTDTVHLRQADPGAWDGWTVAIIEQAGGSIQHIPVKSFDPAAHKITLMRNYSRYRKKINPKRDRYYMENHISTLDGPGQYVIRRTEGGGCRIYAWPSRLKDGKPLIEAPKRGNVIEATGMSHWVLDGLEIAFGRGQGIGMGRSGKNADLVIQNCYIHRNASYGIGLRGPERVTIRRNIVRQNGLGVNISGARDCLVEENDIGENLVDALVAPGGTRRLKISRNFIHDQFRMGHPDGIQFWSDVKDVTIESNLIFNCGQGMMSQGMDGIKIVNNVWCGSRAVLLICGGDNFEIRNNTIVASGLQPTSLIGNNYTVIGNIIAPLRGLPLYSIRDLDTFRGDHNLLWAGKDYTGALVVLGRWRKTARSLAEIREKFGQEASGIVADPKFVSAPKLFGGMDYRRTADCTRTKFYLSSTAGFAVGDHVEVAFDGIARKIVETGKGYIVVDKPLKKPPLVGLSVANWGEKEKIVWDLRLAKDSPARGSGLGGRDIGSAIDVRAYRRGDFNGDGKRDLREIPKGWPEQ